MIAFIMFSYMRIKGCIIQTTDTGASLLEATGLSEKKVGKIYIFAGLL